MHKSKLRVPRHTKKKSMPRASVLFDSSRLPIIRGDQDVEITRDLKAVISILFGVVAAGSRETVFS
jgi:hypothetical protein